MEMRLLALVGTLAVAGGAFIVAAPQAGAGQEFSLVSHQTNIQFVIGGVSSASPPNGPLVPGDRLLFRDDLLQEGKVVGWDNVICTVTFNDNFLCDAMYTITNRGDIHLSALLRGAASESSGPTIFDAVVDGGTFAYQNAHGYVHVFDLPNGDQQNNFVLSSLIRYNDRRATP